MLTRFTSTLRNIHILYIFLNRFHGQFSAAQDRHDMAKTRSERDIE